jgi:hypothetical protein
MCALGLGDFVLVVGKLQVLATAVDVEVLAEQVGTHRRAFDMPARSAIAPRRRPERLARFRVFPQDEVERVVLGLSTSTRSPARRSSTDLPESLP